MSLWQWRVWPVGVKRVLFRIAPGRWTATEVADINRRAQQRYEQMRRLSD